MLIALDISVLFFKSNLVKNISASIIFFVAEDRVIFDMIEFAVDEEEEDDDDDDEDDDEEDDGDDDDDSNKLLLFTAFGTAEIDSETPRILIRRLVALVAMISPYKRAQTQRMIVLAIQTRRAETTGLISERLRRP